MRHGIFAWAALFLFTGWADAQEKSTAELAELLRKIDVKTYDSKEKQQELAGQVWKAVQARREAANEKTSRAWHEIQNRDQWEAFRDRAIAALRDSLGQFPPPPKDMQVQVTGKLAGAGFIVENVVYETRPGLWATANLYSPEKPAPSMPGILIIHSHHNAKTQGELQDMGMTWARLGCLVLVPDQLGHGERRQHHFASADKYPGAFKPGRQDYYFRYNSAMQLHLIGESLIGWMAWDMMRGVDLLLNKPGIDKSRIILLGSVAGGGDPAGVTAALDPRITAVAPFNFGGPQPETKYPAAEIEKRYNYMGGGSWESTRGLRLGGRDGFQPWIIVGSVAPRGLIHAHEFAWDGERDPVWKRYQKIFSFYDGSPKLGVVHGSGSVTGKPPESTHCNNIGAVHRKPMYPLLKKWFDMAEPDKEYQVRFKSEELQCLTAKAREALKPRPLHELAAEIGGQRGQAFWDPLRILGPEGRRHALQTKWDHLLGMGREKNEVTLGQVMIQSNKGPVEVTLRTIVHQAAPYPAEEFPFLLLVPAQKKGHKLPVVIGLAQDGRQGFLTNRAEVIAGLLQKGVAVCLPDFRGSGEMRTDGRGRTSSSTSLSANEMMLGRTVLGSQLEELGMLLDVLRGGKVIAADRITVWGDSFAAVNGGDRDLAAPLDADKLPASSEPLGGLLALFGGLFFHDVQGIYVRGGLVSYRSILDSPYLYVPHDAAIPGALTAGDLADVAGALAPRPLRLEALVDGQNRRVDAARLNQAYQLAQAAYQAAKAGDQLILSAEAAGNAEILASLLRAK